MRLRNARRLLRRGGHQPGSGHDFHQLCAVGWSTRARKGCDVDEELRADISAASEAEVETALHAKATEPPVTITASDYPDVQRFDLYRDASQLERRKGEAAASLSSQR